MQVLPPNSQTPALVGFLPTLWTWFTQVVGLAAVLLVITQNLDLDFSAKEVRTKLHYKGNVLIDLAKPHDK